MQYRLNILILYTKLCYIVRQEFEPKELYGLNEDIKKMQKWQAEKSNPGAVSIKLRSRTHLLSKADRRIFSNNRVRKSNNCFKKSDTTPKKFSTIKIKAN